MKGRTGIHTVYFKIKTSTLLFGLLEDTERSLNGERFGGF